jgi:hypothetical protein
MNSYNVVIQDIYEKEKQKHVSVSAQNAQLAHKAGLRHTSALREEISLVKDSKNNVVFTFKDGFVEVDE